MSALITIITPTYNRGKLLVRLYDSLCKQTSFDFEWLIVDDGSKDNTKEIVKTFKNDSFNVEYISKENGGKHTALNLGISRITSKLTFIVDSDDWLTPSSIETIKNYYLEYKDKSLGGFSFLRMYPDGKLNVTSGRDEDTIASYNQIRILENRVGDMAEVYFTDVLKKYPFPVIDGERFMSEDIVWVEIGKKYKLLYVNKPIYVSDYLEDGLTKNRRENNIKSSKGCFLRAKEFSTIKLPIKLKIKNALQYQIYGRFSSYGFSYQFKNNKNKLLFLLLYLPSFMLYLRWKKNYS